MERKYIRIRKYSAATIIHLCREKRRTFSTEKPVSVQKKKLGMANQQNHNIFYIFISWTKC